MSWALLTGLALGLALALLGVLHRRHELSRLGERVEELRTARERGTRKARLSYPHVDLSRCLGCGACVRACPEEGVLALIHGQALVVHGARCVGHGLCARECPTGAIALTLGDVETRRDIPALDERLEVAGSPGLFLGGEVTGYALIRTAIGHGTAIAAEVARRSGAARRGGGRVDLCIVGAGPAGLACALESRARGLSFVVLEQDTLGGTVAKYPRRKLVMTQPVELPLVGRLARTTYAKEELTELWQRVAREQELPIREGVRFTGLEREPDGGFVVESDGGAVRAAHVALMLGRRGTPRRLGVPGEDLPKVAYSLLDAEGYTGRRILVVGGGDSAVEAALALAEQPGNEVTLSYRQLAFSRLKARNERRIADAAADGSVRVLLGSRVTRIEPESVELAFEDAAGARVERVANDDVFVLIGGTPPFEQLERCGVSFDPADRPAAAAPVERGTGFLRALALALAASLAALAWLAYHRGYYSLPAAERPFAPEHERLRPSSPLGLALGCGAALAMALNLSYLLRRRGWLGLRFGQLKGWMSAHVLTGTLALVLALVHGGATAKDTPGTRALYALAIVVATGALGRYVYSFVPRAANGRELELDELQAEIAALAGEFDRENRDFGEVVRAEVQRLAARDGRGGSFLSRLTAVFGARARSRATLRRLREEGLARGLSADQVGRLLALARRAHRAATLAAHFEDVRALISGWRWVHRWVALFLVLVVVVHVLVALRYGGLFS